MRAFTVVAALLCAIGSVAGVRAADVTLVACAPGYPGNTEQAQETMDAFADGLNRATEWPEGRISATYHETLDGALERLARDDAALAIVPLAFFLEFREKLGLRPLAEARHESGELERWSLVTGKGAAPVSGWKITGLSGYSARFVRHVALDGMKALDPQAEIAFSSRILSALRKAARGEPVAALLDQSQTDVLESLPFYEELEVIHQSVEMPHSLVCSVGDRLTAGEAETLSHGLSKLTLMDDGPALLKSLRLSGFRPVPYETLAKIEASFGGAAN